MPPCYQKQEICTAYTQNNIKDPDPKRKIPEYEIYGAYYVGEDRAFVTAERNAATFGFNSILKYILAVPVRRHHILCKRLRIISVQKKRYIPAPYRIKRTIGRQRFIPGHRNITIVHSGKNESRQKRYEDDLSVIKFIKPASPIKR